MFETGTEELREGERERDRERERESMFETCTEELRERKRERANCSESNRFETDLVNFQSTVSVKLALT